jgi:plasmid stabilization system protein ParE
LETAAEYVARDSPLSAATFVQNVTEAAASLRDLAERGQIVPELGDDSIRELLVKPYRLVYQISGNRVFVLTLVHGARRTRRS